MFKTLLHTILIVGLLILSIPSAIAQQCNLQIKGIVVDSHDDTPLEASSVLILENNLTVFSNSKGQFELKDLCEGTYTLYFEHIGCKPLEYKVDLNKDTTSLTIELEHHIEALDEVTVASKSYLAVSDSGVEKRIESVAIQQNSSLQLADIVSKISGVTSLSTGNAISKPIINGLHSSRVMIVNNGVRMEDQEWGSEHAPNMDVNTASSITVVKGANALQYGGDAIGGIILAEPEKIAFKDSIYGRSIVGTETNGRAAFINSALIYSKKNGLQAKLQSSYKKQGDVQTPDYYLTNSANEHKNLSAYIAKKTTHKGISSYFSYVNSTIGILSASHIGDASDLYRALNADRPATLTDFSYQINAPRQEVDHLLLKINAYSIVRDKGKLLLQFDYQNNHRLEYDLRIGDQKNIAALDLKLLSESLSLDYHSYRSNGFQFKSGILGKYQFNYSNPDTGVKRLIPDYVKLHGGVYGIADYELEDKSAFEFGLRFDYIDLKSYKFYQKSRWEDRGYDQLFSDFVISESDNQVLTKPELQFPSLTATLGYHAHFGSNTNLAANITRSKRAPNPAELFSDGLHHSASRIELGDLSFNQETSTKLSVAIEHQSNSTSLSIQPFYNAIKDFIFLRPLEVTQTIRGFFQVWSYEQTKAELYGLDLDFRQKLTNSIEYSSQFSWVHATDLDKNEALISIPPLQFNNELSLSDHNGNQFGIQSSYVGKQNRYPDYNFNIYIPKDNQWKLIDISSTPKAYHLLGLFANLNLSTQSSLSIRVNNLLNTSYRNYLNAMRYFSDELGRTITIQYKINY